MLPFLFTTLKRCLGTEDTKWWSVSGEILSHSSCKQVLRWATVRGLRCHILRFKMRHTFSIGDRSGLQAGQWSTRTLFLRSQDFVMCAECGFALSCWNMHGRPWKRCLLEGSILCSKISMYFSALMVPSQKCKLPLPRALTQPHTMTDPGFWTCCWKQSGWSFSSLVRSTRRPFLPKNTWNTDSSDHSTRFHCVMVHPRCLRAQRSRRRFWTLLT